MASVQRSLSSDSSSSEEFEVSGISLDMDTPEILCPMLLDDKLYKLVQFLLHKYQKKERVTMEEILHNVDHDYREHLTLNFREFCECMCVAFGIEMREVGAPSQRYEFISVLGLTYSGILDDADQILPKVKLLILILIAIFMNGNCVSEKGLRELLTDRKVSGGRRYMVVGEPWEFITKILVQKQYLVRRHVPDSDPDQYEFLWGPRVHAESSKMKVLEHWARLNRASPRSYPHLYTEALREQKDIVRVIEGKEA